MQKTLSLHFTAYVRVRKQKKTENQLDLEGSSFN